jgi:hypothetical protein
VEKVIAFKLLGSWIPNADNNVLHCVGKLCNTSKMDIAQGALAKSSTML